GPVYLDLPGDVLYRDVPEEEVRWVEPRFHQLRTGAHPGDVDQALRVLAAAERPIVVSGSGILWSQADAELRSFVERAGIPFYTTPQGRGVIPEDHPLCLLNARSTAFAEADCVMVVATRLNYVIDYARPPRFRPDARLVQLDIEPTEIGKTRPVDAGLVGDARTVLAQLVEAGSDRLRPDRYASWVARLTEVNDQKRAEAERRLSTSQVPIHPLRLCKEVRDVMDRNAVLSVDGQEILNYGRQAIPIYASGHSLNSGPLGTMGVGLPFGLGAKAAKPDAQVIVVHGDGSFGLNAMEVDTAVRHHLPVLCVISNNGGWTAADRPKAGRDLGSTRYDLMAEALGCYGEHVEEPDQLRPALERAIKATGEGRPAVVNVTTDPTARAQTARFADYST
ncbi:MAG: thiamine pyrophosphate-binding protein, partial [Acidimicrobiales bacterium]|nr:thiamine pyrophosphate-binding protein [Acidimicrobiales bacterium]